MKPVVTAGYRIYYTNEFKTGPWKPWIETVYKTLDEAIETLEHIAEARGDEYYFAVALIREEYQIVATADVKLAKPEVKVTMI